MCVHMNRRNGSSRHGTYGLVRLAESEERSNDMRGKWMHMLSSRLTEQDKRSKQMIMTRRLHFIDAVVKAKKKKKKTGEDPARSEGWIWDYIFVMGRKGKMWIVWSNIWNSIHAVFKSFTTIVIVFLRSGLFSAFRVIPVLISATWKPDLTLLLELVFEIETEIFWRCSTDVSERCPSSLSPVFAVYVILRVLHAREYIMLRDSHMKPT